MPDFKMTMKTSKPSFQRIAVARSLRRVAPRAYLSSTKNRDMVPFVQAVQNRWRYFTARLKEEGYEPFDSKKFGYARNCVPVLVSSTARPEYGGRLIPCSIPLCPFCWSRSVVIRAAELLEPHKNSIEHWRWGKVDRVLDYTGPENLLGWVNGAFDELNENSYEGLIGYAYIWSGSELKDEPKYYGRLLYLGVSSGKDGLTPEYTQAKDAPKAIGDAFAYPAHLMPAVHDYSLSDAGIAAQSVPWWNALRTRRNRALRTKGMFFKAPKLRKPKKTKEDKFDDIYKRLERLERILDESSSGENNNE
jgi:hypothetical protein